MLKRLLYWLLYRLLPDAPPDQTPAEYWRRDPYREQRKRKAPE